MRVFRKAALEAAIGITAALSVAQEASTRLARNLDRMVMTDTLVEHGAPEPKSGVTYAVHNDATQVTVTARRDDVGVVLWEQFTPQSWERALHEAAARLDANLRAPFRAWG